MAHLRHAFAFCVAALLAAGFSAPVAAEPPVLVCTPGAQAAGLPVPAICSADIGFGCDAAKEILQNEDIDCQAKYVGDCTVNGEGETITAWLVSGSFVGGPEDSADVFMVCQEDGEDGVVIAACPVQGNGVPCEDTGNPAPGAGYCIFAGYDADDGTGADLWTVDYACEDPPLVVAELVTQVTPF